MKTTKLEAEPVAWQRVAAAVVARRSYLGLTQEELAANAAVSPTTIRYIETAARPAYRALTLARVAGALEWPASRFVELLAGEAVEEDDEYAASAGDDLRDERIRDLEAQVEALTAKVDAIFDRLVGKARVPKRAAKRPPQR
jgi:transcriptional regulator with XRE-family HTH domain